MALWQIEMLRQLVREARERRLAKLSPAERRLVELVARDAKAMLAKR